MIAKQHIYTAALFFVLVLTRNVFAQNGISVTVPPMNDPPTGAHLPGKIVWHDLYTRDILTAREFYKNLFGWRYQAYNTVTDNYTMFFYKGKSVAGMWALEPGNENENQWISYISVLDVNQAANQVAVNGGKVLLSANLLQQLGELAIFTDPDGAAFGVLNSLSGDPEDILAKPNEWIWADLLARKPMDMTRFYQSIGNYSVTENTRSAVPDSYYLRADGFARAGVGPLPDTDVLPNWLPYVRIENVMEAINKVTLLGGTVVMQPDPAVFGGKLAVVADPTGAVLGIVQIRQ